MKRSLRSRVLSMLMALVMVFSVFPANAFAADSDSVTATLVTDVSELKAGDKVIIAAKDSDYALSTNQKTNNRGQAAITKDGNSATLTADVQILTLEVGAVDGTFAFHTGSGYLYAAGQSKAQGASKNQNYLKNEASLSANSSWKITITTGETSKTITLAPATKDLSYKLYRFETCLAKAISFVFFFE